MALEQCFSDPGPLWRGKPFWAWNGDLQEDELLRQIEIFRKMGMGGFFMHSRTGLQTEYLGQKWFELVRSCAEKSAELGLEAWIYDEDRWPSGTCGGKVTAHEQLRARFLKLDIQNLDTYSPQPDTIAQFVASMEGFSYYDCIAAGCSSSSEEVRRVAGEIENPLDLPIKVLCFSIELEQPSSFYNGYTWIDALNREAADLFIATTHERYLEECSHLFGTAIRGIFTDEPNRGTIFDSFNLKNEDPQFMCPYTGRLFDEFEKRFGYDLKQQLPELFLKPGGVRISPVKWQYVELLQQLFLENYAKPVHTWCREHNLILTGHILHEDSLAAQCAASGSVMRYYQWMDYPGIDILGEANRNYHVVKQLASVCRQLGKRWMLSELYGGTGWQMNFKSHKWVGDWQTLLGINLRCHHLSWYTAEGEAKRDYPASIAHQSSWYEEYEQVETYFSRFGLFMSRGRAVCSVLVLNPVESLWASIYPGCSEVLSSKDPVNQRIEREYVQLLQWLLGSRIDFDYGDEGLIADYGSVSDDPSRAVFRIGEMDYTTVIVASLQTIRSSTLDLLSSFAAAGGNLIVAGDPPEYVDALKSQRVQDLAASMITCEFDKQQIIDAVQAVEVSFVQCYTGDGVADEHIITQVRKDGDDYLVGVINLSYDNPCEQLEVRFAAGMTVEQWDLLAGTVTELPTHRTVDGQLVVETMLHPAGSRMFRVSNTKSAAPLEHNPNHLFRSISAGSRFTCSLDSDNICVLDRALVRMDGKDLYHGDILKADCAVRSTVGYAERAGDMIQPWLEKQQSVDTDDTPAPVVTCCFSVTYRGGSINTLCIERITACLMISINGTKIPVHDDGKWIDQAFEGSRLTLVCSHVGRTLWR